MKEILHTNTCSTRLTTAETLSKTSLNPDPDCPRCKLNAAAPELLASLKDLQQAVREHGLLDIKKRFSLCAADAQADTAIDAATS